MIEPEDRKVRLEGSELESVQEKMKLAQGHLSDLAHALGSKMRGAAVGSTDVDSVTYGAKKLIVRTADGYCYVWDNIQHVCRFCDGVSDGET